MKKLWIPLLGFLTYLQPAAAMASASSGGGLPFDGWLTKVLDSFTGPVAFVSCIVALVTLGVMMVIQGHGINEFSGKLLFVVLAFAFIIGAKSMMSGLFGTAALVF